MVSELISQRLGDRLQFGSRQRCIVAVVSWNAFSVVVRYDQKADVWQTESSRSIIEFEVCATHPRFDGSRGYLDFSSSLEA